MLGVFFVFYTLEILFNVFCMAFHITGFMAIDLSILSWEKQILQYSYLVIFYGHTVLTVFQSVNICTGHQPNLIVEVVKASIAAIAFTSVSILTMWNAEKDFHILYLADDNATSFREQIIIINGTDENVLYDFDNEVHPFFGYMRDQAISALTCGVLYMLHAAIVIDIWMGQRSEEPDIVPLELFVFGATVQRYLEKYDWFNEWNQWELN